MLHQNRAGPGQLVVNPCTMLQFGNGVTSIPLEWNPFHFSPNCSIVHSEVKFYSMAPLCLVGIRANWMEFRPFTSGWDSIILDGSPSILDGVPSIYLRVDGISSFWMEVHPFWMEFHPFIYAWMGFHP